jgi:hypothetical protein
VQVVQLHGDATGNVDGEFEALVWGGGHVKDVFGDGVHVQAVHGVAGHLKHDWLTRVPASALVEGVAAEICAEGDCAAEDEFGGEASDPHAAKTATAAPIALALSQIQLLLISIPSTRWLS